MRVLTVLLVQFAMLCFSNYKILAQSFELEGQILAELEKAISRYESGDTSVAIMIWRSSEVIESSKLLAKKLPAEKRYEMLSAAADSGNGEALYLRFRAKLTKGQFDFNDLQNSFDAGYWWSGLDLALVLNFYFKKKERAAEVADFYFKTYNERSADFESENALISEADIHRFSMLLKSPEISNEDLLEIKFENAMLESEFNVYRYIIRPKIMNPVQ